MEQIVPAQIFEKRFVIRSTMLIESCRSNPQDKELKQYWSDLLSDSDVELEDLISEPIVECCSYIYK